MNDVSLQYKREAVWKADIVSQRVIDEWIVLQRWITIMQADDLPSLYTNKYKLDDSRTDALSWQRYVNMFVRLYDVQEG